MGKKHLLCLLLALATDRTMDRRKRVVWLHAAGFLAFVIRPFLSVVYAAAVLATLLVFTGVGLVNFVPKRGRR